MDVVDLRNFYAHPLGTMARRLIGRGIRRMWPGSAGLRVLGIGYATPYLGLFREDAERCLAFMPAAQGVLKWPTTRPALSALVDENELPLPDNAVDRVLLRIPIAGEVWLKYQVAQFSRVLSTLLIGGIPLMQALVTSADSLGTQVLKKVLDKASKLVREGQSLSGSLRTSGVFPGLAIDMIEVGESTGALAAMLSSVAEFYEDDVANRTTAALSLIEPALMICMGVFVGFVLVSLYLPIFSLADSMRG